MMDDLSPQARALRVRRRALDNMGAILVAEAERADGCFRVQRVRDDAFTVRFPRVRTLVRTDGRIAIAERSFLFIVAAPPDWPLDRDDALQTYVSAPADWCHPNASGPALCLRLAGVMPEELPRLLAEVGIGSGPAGAMS